jgi:hypothetical protein
MVPPEETVTMVNLAKEENLGLTVKRVLLDKEVKTHEMI